MLTSQNLLCSITPQTSQQKYKSVAQTSYNSNLLNNDKNSVLLQQNHKQTPDLYIKDNKLDKFNSTINRRTLSLTSSSMNCEFKNKQNLNNNDCNKKISSSIADDNLYYFNKTSTISSNTSTALSRFFQRSSPFRRSIATCSVYSSSSTSGYSGISSASPKSSVKLKSKSLNPKTLQLTSRKNQNTNFCFNLLYDSLKHSKKQKSETFKHQKNKNADVFDTKVKNNLSGLDEFIDYYYKDFNQNININKQQHHQQQQKQKNISNKITKRSTTNVNNIIERREKALSTYDNV